MITQKYVNDLSYKIVGCAIEVHKELGPGLLEIAYERAMKYELKSKNLKFESQVQVPVLYKGNQLDCRFRLDLIVEELVIVELKSVKTMIPLFQAQLMTYLKLLKKPKGLLINFECDNIVKNLVPIVSEFYSILQSE